MECAAEKALEDWGSLAQPNVERLFITHNADLLGMRL
jgi:hypothetical protein